MSDNKNSYTVNQLKAIAIMKLINSQTFDYNISITESNEYQQLLEQFIIFSESVWLDSAISKILECGNRGARFERV